MVKTSSTQPADGYTAVEKELMAFQEAHNSTPDVVAHKAFYRIMGEHLQEFAYKDDAQDPYSDGTYLDSLETVLHNAIDEKQPDAVVAKAQADLDAAKKHIMDRNAISIAFYNEIAEVRSSRTKQHLLCITQDDPTKPIGQVRLSKISVAKWAKIHVGRVISEWDATVSRQQSRTYTTPILDVMDAAIAEYWESWKGEPAPSNAEVEAWIRQEFPEMKFSQYTLTAIAKLIRHPEAKGQ